jgi:predicted nuclease of predicted toxin-antitoxin system
MKLWIDAQLSPAIALWLRKSKGLDAVAVRDVGMRDADDIEIFNAARDNDAIVLTKDRDFVLLLDRFGPPPSVIWLTCGNTSNEVLKRILEKTVDNAIDLIISGEPLVEINTPLTI